jgi:hypothetical protein
MKTKMYALLGIAALMASVAFAHGDKKHIIGTLEKINPDSVVVKTAAGKSVEVKLTASTMYISRVGNEDKSAKVSDLAVGYRVVIHATGIFNGIISNQGQTKNLRALASEFPALPSFCLPATYLGRPVDGRAKPVKSERK